MCIGYSKSVASISNHVKMAVSRVCSDYPYLNQAGCSIYCSRTFGTLFRNVIKWSAHGVLEQFLFISVQLCITILISYSHIEAYNDSPLFVYLSMLLQLFYSLILPNPDVQIAYNKYMSKQVNPSK